MTRFEIERLRHSPEPPPRFGVTALALQVIVLATEAAPHLRFMDLCEVTRIGIAMHCRVAPPMSARHQLGVREYSRVGHAYLKRRSNLIFNFKSEILIDCRW